jgi:hypothetical protein
MATSALSFGSRPYHRRQLPNSRPGSPRISRPCRRQCRRPGCSPTFLRWRSVLPRRARSRGSAFMLRRPHDHHRDLRARQQRPRAALRWLDKRSPSFMIMPRSSPRIISAEGPYRPRKEAFVRPPPTACLTTPKSLALRRSRRARHGIGRPRAHPDSIIPTRQAHHSGHCRPSENVKSP